MVEQAYDANPLRYQCFIRGLGRFRQLANIGEIGIVIELIAAPGTKLIMDDIRQFLGDTYLVGYPNLS